MRSTACFLVLFSQLFIGAATSMADTPLQYADPRDLSIQDAIPRSTGERIVLFNRRLEARWLAVLIDIPYEETRQNLHDLIDKTFGIETATERTERILEDRRAPTRSQEPLFGPAGIEFRRIGLSVSEGRELTVRTKKYHQSGEHEFAMATWRIIDGGRLFGKPLSLLVVSRTDHSREWARTHGPPFRLPFKVSGENELITDTETKLIDAVLRGRGARAEYFVQPPPGQTPTELTDLMATIRDRAHQF